MLSGLSEVENGFWLEQTGPHGLCARVIFIPIDHQPTLDECL